MVYKIASALLAAIVNIMLGIAIGFFLLVAMNGYSESDAQYGLTVYVILAIIVTLLMAGSAFVITKKLFENQWHGVLAALVSVTAATIFGAILKMICSIIGIAVSEVVRVNF